MLAILMISLAPTVSQLIADLPLVEGGSACPMESMQRMDDRGDHRPTAPHSHATDVQGGLLCGYCGLLAHTPLLSHASLVLSFTVRFVQRATTIRYSIAHRALPRASAQPRAPPYFI
ncbi:DUF2946 domain-containing protein [Caballeronia grimmiae]|uniref:DUF2946 domain-containing protein n=1 Tax=Caballeronia grimmiae TaxID=1071679 RepID=UPI0035310C85